MKPSCCCRLVFPLLLGTVFLTTRPALADVGFSAAASPSPVAVSNTLTYTFNFTNATGLAIPNIFLTNILSFTPVTIPPGWVSVGSNTIALNIGTLFTGTVLQTNWSIQPFVIGVPTNTVFYTNAVTLVAGGQTNVTTTLITRVLIPQGDLSVSIALPTQEVLANDIMAVTVTVTNRGPDTVPNVLLTNLLPTSFILLTPTNLIQAFTNGILAVNLGRLTSGGSTNLQLTFQPTNSGSFVLDAVVVAASLVDTNLANNATSTNVSIGAFLTTPGEVTINIVTQRFNFLTGLLEMTVTMTNGTTNDLPAARVLASGLPTGARLYNASGTNNSNGYVLYNATLAAGASINLTLEFYVLKVSTFTNYTLTAFGVQMIDLNAPTSSGAIISGMVYTPGGFLLKFAATIGKTYTVLYSDDSTFANAKTAQPSIVAPATQVQWIDNGPPKTAAPTGSARYYRVIPND